MASLLRRLPRDIQEHTVGLLRADAGLELHLDLGMHNIIVARVKEISATISDSRVVKLGTLDRHLADLQDAYETATMHLESLPREHLCDLLCEAHRYESSTSGASEAMTRCLSVIRTFALRVLCTWTTEAWMASHFAPRQAIEAAMVCVGA